MLVWGCSPTLKLQWNEQRGTPRGFSLRESAPFNPVPLARGGGRRVPTPRREDEESRTLRLEIVRERTGVR